MNIAKVLEKRQLQWVELEQLCDVLEVSGKDRKGGAAAISRFATLYRAACADLALADSYQLPPATVTYLHRLVARAHNRLYRASRIDPSTWADTVFRIAPQQIFIDPCVRVATLLFFGLFTLAAVLGANEQWFPDFVQQLVGQTQIDQLEAMYEKPISGSLNHYVSMAGFYIMHNTGIGLQCFAFGILIIPCVFNLAYNAVMLGAMFGYMAREDSSGGANFLHFVTAHGPFELTAIALAGAAGLRFGVGLFYTNGLTRTQSLRDAATRAVPIMAASATLFFLAAFTEGFISPSPLPYLMKAFWAIFSAGLISFYFVVLGFPRDPGSLYRDSDNTPVDPLVDDPRGTIGAT
ncbi:MAG: stage II sporulation protein M [Planctomycetaceae bacterium]